MAPRPRRWSLSFRYTGRPPQNQPSLVGPLFKPRHNKHNRADNTDQLLTTDPPTPHQDRTNSLGKRSPAGGMHPGPTAPTMLSQTQTHHIATTATTAQGETPTRSSPPLLPSQSKCW
ncbi:hypothetical protein AMECASPLE_038631 [Ameca splendens]|uniref:Uncharacterized protein n=1 Tax=Ameca splendens TaxID=208324 RepID=A0ABV0XX93_9TELE